MPGLALHGDVAVMQTHNLCHIVEAYAEAFHVVYVARGDAVEFLEDVLLVGFADADAMVFDAQ